MQDSQRRRVIAGLGAVLASPWLPALAHAASAWPDRPVDFVVPFPPGGPVDTAARFVAKPLNLMWSQPTIIDNRDGAGGIVGAQLAARQPADGYHFFFAAIHHSILPSLRTSLSYDIQKDFDPVGMVAIFPIVLVVNPRKLPAVKSVADLIAYDKAHPGELSFGSSGTGGGTHLAGELFNSMTGTKIKHIPYRGSAPAMQDLLAGQVQVMFADGPSAMPHVKSGELVALGVGNLKHSALFPGLPSIADSGVPGYEAYSWSGLVAPHGTPPEVIRRVNADLDKVLKDPDVAKSMLAAGAEPAPDTPEQVRAFLASELAKWHKVITEAHITVS